MTERCGARDALHLVAHTCDDVLACALGSLDPVGYDEAERLHELLDRVEDLCAASRAKVAGEVLAAIHAERGGPR